VPKHLVDDERAFLRIPLSVYFSEGLSAESVPLAVPAAAQLLIFPSIYVLSCCCCIYMRTLGALAHFVTRGDVMLGPGYSMQPKAVLCNSSVFQVCSATDSAVQRAPDRRQKCCRLVQAPLGGDRAALAACCLSTPWSNSDGLIWC
jgi:hypothetical protein